MQGHTKRLRPTGRTGPDSIGMARCAAQWCLFVAFVCAQPASAVVYRQLPVWVSPSEPTFAIAVADVDMDGDLDVVRGNLGLGATLYLNDGGTLRTSPTWTGPTANTRSIALADVDGDGDPDLICGNSGQPSTLFRNIGGTFESSPSWSSPAADTWSLALADVDQDGLPDLVCGNLAQPSELYLNVGGTFSSLPDWSGPAEGCSNIAVGDIDGDGHPDLVASGLDGPIQVFLGSGRAFSSTPAWSGPWASGTVVALGDVDSDGTLDLVSATYLGGAELYLNRAGLLDTSPSWTGPTESTSSIALGDIDGDGRLDLVRGNYSQRAKIYLNVGGTFATTPEDGGQSEATQSVVLVDLDGDADLDLIRGNSSGGSTAYLNDAPLLEGAPAWTSTATFTPEFTAPEGLGLAVGDVNGDGTLDFAIGGSSGFFANLGGYFGAYPDWSVTFPPGRLPRPSAEDVALGDVDGDGALDLLLGETNAPGPSDRDSPLFFNAGGTFGSTPSACAGGLSGNRDILLDDVNGDSRPDLIRANTRFGVSVLLNAGGQLVPPAAYTLPQALSISLGLQDMNGDGIRDLVVGGTASSPARIFPGGGGGFAVTPSWAGPAEGTSSIALGDVDGDGDADLLRGNLNGPLTLYRNTNGDLGNSPSWSGTSEPTTSVALGDLDGDGDLDLVRGNTAPMGCNVLLNRGGDFENAPNWTDTPASIQSIALADFDSDGRLDLLKGSLDQPSTLTRGKSPWLTLANARDPIRALPENPGHLRQVRISEDGENRMRIQFLAVDAERDSLWVVGEYEFEGASRWMPMDLGQGSFRVGPLATSPTGILHEVTWDVSRVAFDSRPVAVRLRAISPLRHAGTTQFLPSYLLSAGRIYPARPAASVSPASLPFPATTLGDTAVLQITLKNAGTRELVISDFSPSLPALSVVATTPLRLAAGASLIIPVQFAPREPSAAAAFIRVLSNDPLQPELDIPVDAEAKGLTFRTNVLSPSPTLPLGEAVTVSVLPDASVHIERGYLFFNSSQPPGAPFDSTEIVAVGGQFLALIPGQHVTEGGIGFFVRVENSGIVALDPPGAPGLLFERSVSSPESLLTIVHDGPTGGHPVNQSVIIGVSVPQGTRPESARVLYRAGGAADYDSTEAIEFAPEASSVDLAIPPTAVGPRGVEFRVEVRTQTRILEDPRDPAASPRSFASVVPSLSEPGSHRAGRYRLVSFPVDFSSASDLRIESFVTDDLGAPDPTRWRIFRWDPIGSRYLEAARNSPSDPLLAPRPDRSFWLISRDPNSLDTAPISGQSVPTSGDYRISLEPGWNQAAHPFLFPVRWKDIQVEGLSQGSFLEPPVLWDEASATYQGSSGATYADTLILRPFSGYWIRNGETHPITLIVPARETIQPASSNAAASTQDSTLHEGDPSAWSVQVILDAGSSKDAWNVAGVCPGASDGVDRFDRSEPPPTPGDAVAMYFISEVPGAPSRACDMRTPFDLSAATTRQGCRWAIGMSRFDNASDPQAARLTVQGLESVPKDYSVRLLDHELRRSIDLRSTPRYDFVLSAPGGSMKAPARFSLVVGSAAFADSAVAEPEPATLRTQLLPVRPNPVVGNSLIRYEIARAGRVLIEIFDLSGRRVRVLVDRAEDAGAHEALWSGDDDDGRSLPPGVYALRFTAATRGQSMKLVRIH